MIKSKLDVCDMCGKLKPNVSKLVDSTDFLTSNICQDCLHMPQEMLEKLPERQRFKIMLQRFTEDVRLKSKS